MNVFNMVLLIFLLLVFLLLGDNWFYRSYYGVGKSDIFGRYKEWRIKRKERLKTILIVAFIMLILYKVET